MGHECPDVSLLTRAHAKLRLHELLHPGRPLVLNFGSIGSKAWRDTHDDMEEMFTRFGSYANFAHVYIKNYHDQSSLRPDPDYPMPPSKSVDDRIAAAMIWTNERKPRVPIYMDMLNDRARILFGAGPERFYIIDGDTGLILLKGGMGNM